VWNDPYDPQGKGYGGGNCVKHALFDENGYPLESLLTFTYIRNG
jgi:arabinogalactan endo-1,4-beta-galactosidase